MTEALNRNQVTKPVTFPVRAGLAAQSYSTLTSLIESSASGTTLTIWSSDSDPVDYIALNKLIMKVGHDKVYIDMPNSMMDDLHLKNRVSSVHPSLSLFSCLMIICTVLAVVNSQ